MAMTVFERTAVFTVINNIEQQLQGLKTLLAAAGQNGTERHVAPRKSAETDPSSVYTTDKEDEAMSGLMNSEFARLEAERLEKEAEAFVQARFAAAQAGLAANQEQG